VFKLPDKVKDDVKNYDKNLKQFLENKISLSRFKGIRVPWGVYSHRGGKVYMTRIRIPAGLLSSSQLKALANASNKWGNGVLHLTTRQDIQIHEVKIEDTIKVIDYLKEFNLSPRGGGGNTVRNILCCPYAGICKKEIFNVRGYAVALSEYLLRQETSYTMPRKLKIAFSGCNFDCDGVAVNDLGFLAKELNGKKGFKVFVAGGLGANPKTGYLLHDFLLEEDIGYCVQAIKNVFYKKGDRRNKHHNRLRFLVQDDLGFEKFKELYKKEFKELKDKEYIVLRKINFDYQESDGEIPKIKEREFNDFLNFNVLPQKQKGFSIVKLRIPRGDIEWQKVISLAELESEFKGIKFVTTQNQNLAIIGVKNEELYKLFLTLNNILNDFLYPDTILDIVCCKGALTCNLGLCNSPGLTFEFEKVIKDNFLKKNIFDKLNIKINGCPNACGHHPIGKLAFHGLARRVNNRPVPFYKFLLGGRKSAEKTTLAQEVGIIPAKNTPEFLKDLLQAFENQLDGKIDIYKFLREKGGEIANQVLKKYKYVPAYSENKQYYTDWGKKEEFSLAGLGPGECGAGVLDVIEADLTEAEIALEESEKKEYTVEEIKKVIFYSARALLVVRGVDPKDEQEVFNAFKENFITPKIASDFYSNLDKVYWEMKEEMDFDTKKEKFNYAKEFLKHIKSLYKSMDSSFNFPTIKKEGKEEKVQLLDLKGTPCPLNYVKAKLALENLKNGAILEVLLDEGEPMENVPRSLEQDGHEILKIEKQDGFYRIIVKKIGQQL
jgi:sulfite reductase (ferredoxin)